MFIQLQRINLNKRTFLMTSLRVSSQYKVFIAYFLFIVIYLLNSQGLEGMNFYSDENQDKPLTRERKFYKMSN